jgi:hypothetical protein
MAVILLGLMIDTLEIRGDDRPFHKPSQHFTLSILISSLALRNPQESALFSQKKQGRHGLSIYFFITAY